MGYLRDIEQANILDGIKSFFKPAKDYHEKDFQHTEMWRLHRRKGNHYRRKGNYSAAHHHYMKAIRLHPNKNAKIVKHLTGLADSMKKRLGED